MKKGRGLLGPSFFKQGKGTGVASHDHGQTVVATTAMVDPTVWPWQPTFAVLIISCGQQTPRAARGESHGPW